MSEEAAARMPEISEWIDKSKFSRDFCNSTLFGIITKRKPQ